MSAPSDVRPADVTRVFLRPLGTPLPLGLFAYAVGTALTLAQEAHFIPASESRTLAFAMLGLVAPLELLTGVLAFLSRDAGAATLLGTFGALWTVTGLGFLTGGAAQTTITMGLLYALLAVVLLIVGFVSLAPKPFFALLLFTSTIRLGLMSAFQFSGAPALHPISAAVGALIALLAYYAAAALLVEDLKHRPVLPTFRRGVVKRSFEGDLASQIGSLNSEAGVRSKL